MDIRDDIPDEALAIAYGSVLVSLLRFLEGQGTLRRRDVRSILNNSYAQVALSNPAEIENAKKVLYAILRDFPQRDAA